MRFVPTALAGAYIIEVESHDDSRGFFARTFCAREFANWAREFSPNIEFEVKGRLCVESDRCESCRFVFRDAS